MIDFSISSVNMAILVSNLFIIFLVLIFRNRKVMFRLGLPLLVGFVTGRNWGKTGQWFFQNRGDADRALQHEDDRGDPQWLCG